MTDRSGSPDRPPLPRAVTGVVDQLTGASGVQAVVLGGSRVHGTATEDSDWDLGVYYRQPLDLEPLRALGELHPPGSWGRLMNGGAWLVADGVRIDVLLRDLAAVDHWTAEAHRGTYEVDGLLGYLAGIPTYTLTAEVASSLVLTGELDVPSEFPDALTRSAPDRWRFHRDFSLAYARRAAILGSRVIALGQLARATVEEAHARHCERRTWVLNEKRILDRVGLVDAVPREGADDDLVGVVDAATTFISAAEPE